MGGGSRYALPYHLMAGDGRRIGEDSRPGQRVGGRHTEDGRE